MSFYLLIFFFNILFAYIADRNYRTNKTVCFTFIAFIAILNSVIYGLRNFGVGVDSALYVKGYFEQSSWISSFSDFIELRDYGDLGYFLLGYIGSLFTKDPQVLLFFSAALFWIFFALSIYQMKKMLQLSMWVYVLLFNLVMGIHTLNFMRQFCAMGLLFLGFAYLLQGRWKLYIVLQVLAYFFHSSSITFLIIPVFYYLSEMENTDRRNFITIIGFVVIVVLVMSVWLLLSRFAELRILAENYSERYGEGGREAATGQFEKFNYTRSVIDIYSLFMVFLAWKQKALSPKVAYLSFVMVLYLAILHNSSFALRNIDRVYIYIEMIGYVYLSLAYQSKKISFPFKLLGYAMFLYLFYRTISNPQYGVVPYVSKILGI